MLRPRQVNVRVDAPTQYVTREIHEHRAPTDESVKLLREMEDKAREKIEQSIRVGNNGFECTVTVEWEAISDEKIVTALFALNGKRMRAEARLLRYKVTDEPMQLAEAIRDAVAQVIAAEVLKPALMASMFRK